MSPTEPALRIALLSERPDAYSTRRLVEAAGQRGHQVTVLSTLACSKAKPPGTGMICAGQRVGPFDAVIPRIGAPIIAAGAAVLAMLEAEGGVGLNSAAAMLLAAHKARAIESLVGAGLPMPRTLTVEEPEEIAATVAQLGGYPVVVKALAGSGGRGVSLVSSLEAAYRRVRDGPCLFQAFVAEAKGCDLRLFVIGDRVAAAMMRQAQRGEFRANLSLGAEALAIAPKPDEIRLALAATRTLGLEVAGVDLVRSRHGPLLLEVNGSPGLQGIERVSGVGLAEHIIFQLEAKVSARLTNRAP